MKEKTIQFITSISPDFLWGILAFVLSIFLILAFVLQYHWRNYSVDTSGKLFARSIFWIISIILVLTATLAIISFES